VYYRIMVPLDGSALAEAPLSYAGDLAAKSGAEVVLLHVCVPKECRTEDQDGSTDSTHRIYLERTAQKLERSLESARLKGPRVSWAILTGEPSYVISTYPDENRIDLVVMSTHGRSGVRHWAMGSVAVHVHRCSNVPVRLVRSFPARENPPENWPEKEILVLLDGSDAAEQALPYAVQHATMSDGILTLLRVSEPLQSPSDYPKDMPLSWEEHLKRVTEHQTERNKRYLRAVASRLRGEGLTVRTRSLAGNAAEEIIKYVEAHSFNLITLTTTARCSGSVWPIGSVADKVINGTSSPVLLVKPH
jgi:nucleotide-binding universal stress UspA family protein